MSISQEINTFLTRVDAVAVKFNIKYKVGEYAYYKGNMVLDNVPFIEVLKKSADIFGLKFDKSLAKDIEQWIIKDIDDTLVFYNDDFNDVRNAITISKLKLDDNHYMVLIENLEKKRKLLETSDPLTNLYQKSSFISLLNDKIESEGKPFTLCTLDVDNFKELVDTYGQAIGNDVLVKISNILKQDITDGAIARFGTDDFAFAYFKSVDYQEIWGLLYKVAHDIQDIGASFVTPINVTVTIGCSRFGIDVDNLDDLFLDADKALYRGKRKGKNCFIIYDAEKHKNINIDSIRKNINVSESSGSSIIVEVVKQIYNQLNSSMDTEENLDKASEIILRGFTSDRVAIYYDGNDNTEKPIAYAFKDLQKVGTITLEPTFIGIWDQSFKNGICEISNLDVESEDGILLSTLRKQQISAVLRVPLTFKGTKIGSLEIAQFAPHKWSALEKDLLTVCASVLSIAMYKEHENIYMEHKMTIDELTGLLNYSRFMTLATNRLNESNRRMLCYYLNFERFKSINDKFGYSVGNHVLKSFASTLRKTFNNGIIARIASDRFIVMDYYDTNEDILNKFSAVKYGLDEIEHKGEKLGDYLTVSCGVYITDGTENVISAVVDKANLARNSLGTIYKSDIAIFTQEMHDKFNDEQKIEMHFPDALKNNEFKLYLQPKIDIETGKLVGAEALCRWKYENQNLLSPAQFIPKLEASGLILELDLHMFEVLCKTLRLIKDRGYTGFVPISVNLSRNQKDFEDYIDRLEAIRKKYDIDPSLIEIEITESTFTENIVEIKKLIYYIHRLGYKVAMDDFGSGYSNLSSLVECGFDVIKIDKSLCAAEKSDKKSYILEAVINMTKNLGIEIICEGVETQTQANNLLRLGCRHAQGYLYDKPLPANDFINKYMETR